MAYVFRKAQLQGDERALTTKAKGKQQRGEGIAKGSKGREREQQRAGTKGKHKARGQPKARHIGKHKTAKGSNKGETKQAKGSNKGEREKVEKGRNIRKKGKTIPEMDLEPVRKELLVTVGAGDFVWQAVLAKFILHNGIRG